MTLRAGVLSDTHLIRPDSRFKRQIRHCFDDCDIIIHAGDITEPSILEVLGKTSVSVYAVHGNMCSAELHKQLPEATTFPFGDFIIGLTHGARLGYDIEKRLWDLFPETDCMIYGHTHRPTCHKIGQVLIINPGSFQATSRYGAPGTYAILEAGETLVGKIFEIPPTL